MLGAGLPSAGWAAAIEPTLLSVTRCDLTLPRWPKALDGFRLAHLTDLHFRPGTDEALIGKLRSALADEQPDLIAISGDFVIHDPSSLSECLRALKGISAPHGIFASPGNHDCWHFTPSQLKKEIEGAGLAFLENTGSTVTIKGESIFINGLDSFWGGHPDPTRAWKGCPRNSPVLSLVHEPDPFADLQPLKPLDLQLSGHTHGGQCRVPFLNYAPIKVKYGRKFIYGEFQQDHSRLFVGRGLGTVGLRVRFACQPELAILRLRSA